MLERLKLDFLVRHQEDLLVEILLLHLCGLQILDVELDFFLLLHLSVHLGFHLEVPRCRVCNKKSFFGFLNNLAVYSINLIDEIFHMLEAAAFVSLPFVVKALVEHLNNLVLVHPLYHLRVLLVLVIHITLARGVSLGEG